MSTLKEQLENWSPGKTPRVVRSGATYEQTRQFALQGIQQQLDQYRALGTYDQTARLTRDLIDWYLRRYHEYCIQQHQGAHYRQVGLSKTDKTDFEHVLPARLSRDALLSGRMTIEQALLNPTATISRDKHSELAATGYASKTPDVYYFFRRYANLGIEIETRDGTPVDLQTWSLDNHYAHFITDL